jgi:hypothetical protein
MIEAVMNIEFLKWCIPLVGAVIAWLANERWKRGEHRRDIKRKACLDALLVIDAHFSNLEWTGIVSTERQPPPDVQRAREVYNNLCVTCSSLTVLRAYKKCLGVYEPPNLGEIVDLRNAIRAELGFGGELDTDREKAWIARLNAPASKS